MRITTWNVNSIRLRLEGLKRLVAEQAPDILCLQEIKVSNEHFPEDFIAELGFAHCLVHGQKSYHGVAIFSRTAFERAETRDWCDNTDSRHAYVRLADGIEIHNFYVPAGGDIPDPEKNEKFAHKLRFLAEMAEWFARRQRQDNRFILVGDLNVAPLETDVWSHKQLLKVVSHTPVEVAALAHLSASHRWCDAVRHFIPPEQRLYSWWSYRARDWETSDRGRRLDHIWVTPALRPALRSATVQRPARGWHKPSDHVPVTVTLEL